MTNLCSYLINGNEPCAKTPVARGYCGTHYKVMRRRHGMPARQRRRPLGMDDRELGQWCASSEATNEDPETGCLVWKFPNFRKGYPVMHFRGRSTGVHRVVAWTFHTSRHDFLLPSEIVHHKCHNTSCVNPEHLQITTHLPNIAESLENRRLVKIIIDLGTELSAANDTIRELRRQIDGI